MYWKKIQILAEEFEVLSDLCWLISRGPTGAYIFGLQVSLKKVRFMVRKSAGTVELAG